MISIKQDAATFFQGIVKKIPLDWQGIQLANLCFDSREVKAGDLFVAMPSVAGNEKTYIETAIKNGAAFIFTEKEQKILSVPCVCMEGLTQIIGDLLHALLGNSSQKMNVIGITGTNGKSSISFYLAQLLNELKQPCAVMGTLGYGNWQALTTTGMTTIPVEKLHPVMAKLNESYSAIAMEVSSHGLEQNRLAGVHFKGAVFCNLSRDHLDYHGTMEAYGAEKAKLFTRPNLEFSIINIDDEYSQTLLQKIKCKTLITYGQSPAANLRLEFKSIDAQGMRVEFFWQGLSLSAHLPLYGEFNASNVAAALACLLAMGIDFKVAINSLKALEAVPGRMQQITAGQDKPLVLVDYAHTPDALEKALQAVRAHSKGNISLVVGCGGDRDQGKRPLMAKIALQYADKIVFTSDNPRTESPAKICQQMVDALSAENYQIILDRKEAIATAIKHAKASDLVVIAGKGHEDYQEINGRRSYFSDVKEAETALKWERKL